MRKFDWLVFCRPVQNAMWPGSFHQLNLFWMRVTYFAFDINEIAQSYVWTHYPKQLDQGSKNLWCRSLCSNLVVIIAQKMKMLLVYFSFLLSSITAGKILRKMIFFNNHSSMKHRTNTFDWHEQENSIEILIRELLVNDIIAVGRQYS